MTKTNEYVIGGFTTNSRALLACVACVFASFSLYAGKPEPLDIGKHQFKVHLGIVKSTGKVRIVIENTGKTPVRCSELMSFGSQINVRTPSGKVDVYHEDVKPPKEFTYKPSYVIQPGSEQALSDEALTLIISGLSKPGRYEIWVDITSWIDFDKGKFVKKSSNKLIIFVPEDK